MTKTPTLSEEADRALGPVLWGSLILSFDIWASALFFVKSLLHSPLFSLKGLESCHGILVGSPRLECLLFFFLVLF